jgi:hypothetical protein
VKSVEARGFDIPADAARPADEVIESIWLRTA